MKLRLALVLFVFSLFCPRAESLDQTLPLRIVTEHLAPFHYLNQEQKVVGLLSNRLLPILQNLEPGLKIELLPWSHAYELATRRPNTLLFSVIRTPERESKFVWLSRLLEVNTILIANSDSNVEPTDNLADLMQYNLGVKKNDAITDHLLKVGFEFDNNLMEIVQSKSTITMLRRQRFDLIPTNVYILEDYCKKNDCELDEFKVIYTFDEIPQTFFLVINKDSDPVLIKLLRQELASFAPLTLNNRDLE